MTYIFLLRAVCFLGSHRKKKTKSEFLVSYYINHLRICLLLFFFVCFILLKSCDEFWVSLSRHKFIYFYLPIFTTTRKQKRASLTWLVKKDNLLLLPDGSTSHAHRISLIMFHVISLYFVQYIKKVFFFCWYILCVAEKWCVNKIMLLSRFFLFETYSYWHLILCLLLLFGCKMKCLFFVINFCFLYQFHCEGVNIFWLQHQGKIWPALIFSFGMSRTRPILFI